MSVQTEIQSLITTLEAALPDAVKTDSGQKAAATRVRKALQTVRVKCGDLRKTAIEATRG